MATALPDALDLMTLCLESGLTFERTLSRVVQELETMAPDLAREFALAEAELRLGADRKKVLNDLHVRALEWKGCATCLRLLPRASAMARRWLNP